MFSLIQGLNFSPKLIKISIITILIVIVLQVILTKSDATVFSQQSSLYDKLPFPKKTTEIEVEFYTDSFTTTATHSVTEIVTSTTTVHELTTVTAGLELNSDKYTDEELNAIQEIEKDLSIALQKENAASNSDNNFLSQISSSMKTKFGDTFPETHVLKGKNVANVMKYIVDDIIANDIKNFDSDSAPPIQTRKQYYDFIIEDILRTHKPQVEKLTKEEIGEKLGGKGKYVHSDNPRFSSDYIDQVKVKPEKLKKLKKQHEKLVTQLQDIPQPPKWLFKGRGIVIPSTGDIIPGAMVVVGQLRELGSKLPIEIILNNDGDYDKHVCETILPKLNAECVVLEREIGKQLLDSLQLHGFQLKALSLLVSKFDHTLLLDADNIPIKNVDPLFDSKIYKETKFVFWPDLLSSGISPQFYEIAGIEVGEVVHREGLKNDGNWEEYSKLPLNEVAFYDREGTVPGMSVESGQMLFSKVEHIRALILSIYYNTYGDGLYYHLIYQGAWGWGDKDTFHTALEVMHEPYFLSEYMAWHLGWMKDTTLHDTTVVQHDPVQSESFMKLWRSWLQKNGLDTRLKFAQENQYTKDLITKFLNDHMEEKLTVPDVLFLHIHNPKINPLKNAYRGSEDHGAYARRGLGLPDAYKDSLGESDWELRFQSIAKYFTCNLLGEDYWKKHNKKLEEVCEIVSDFVKFLKKDTLYPKYEELPALELAFAK